MVGPISARAPGSAMRRRAGRGRAISRWSILLVLMLAELTSCMEAAMTYAAFPTFYRIFGDPVAIGWLYTAFLLVAGAAAGLCGAIGDRFGRRNVLLVVLTIATLGSAISTMAPSLGWIIAGRALQGVSLAILPLALGLLRELLPEEEVPMAIGILIVTATAAGSAFYILGGVLLDYLGWRWIFGVTAGVTLAAVIFVWSVIPRGSDSSSSAAGPIDWIGGTLYAPGVMLPLLAISQASVSGWRSVPIIGSALAGLLMLVAWIAWELRHRAPLIDIRLVMTRSAACAFLCYALLSLGAFQFGLIVYATLQEPTWTGAGFGLSATMAGIVNLPSALVGSASGPWSGWLARRHGGRSALIVSLLIYIAGWFIVALVPGLMAMIIAITVIGIGAPMVFGSIANVLVEVTPEDRTSEVLGLAEVIHAMFMAVGSQIMAVILASATVARAGDGVFPSAAAHAQTLYLTIILCLAALGLAVGIPRRAGRPASEPCAA